MKLNKAEKIGSIITRDCGFNVRIYDPKSKTTGNDSNDCLLVSLATLLGKSWYEMFNILTDCARDVQSNIDTIDTLNRFIRKFNFNNDEYYFEKMENVNKTESALSYFHRQKLDNKSKYLVIINGHAIPMINKSFYIWRNNHIDEYLVSPIGRLYKLKRRK
jgi:hypothetical protein